MRPETKLWIEDADYDLESAKAMLDSGRFFFVVFMCHLTVEKLLKAAIVEREGVEPPRIHNLVALAVRACMQIPTEHQPIVNELDTMSVVTRYPDGRRAIGKVLTANRASEIYDSTVGFSKWLGQELK
jgi:HEPN domain-containing protein